MKEGHEEAFPSKLNGFDDPSFSRVPILPQRACAVGSAGLITTKVGPSERDKTDRSQEVNDGLGEALARRLNGIY